MRAVALVFWSDLRRRWLGTIAVAVLIGLVGAVVLSTLAGARRSDTALRRFNAYSRSGDIEVTPGSPSAAQIAEFRRTPGIAALAVLRIYAVRATNLPFPFVANGAPVDSVMNNAVDRPRLIAGRLANPNVADEVNIGESLAEAAHLGVGDTLSFDSWTPAEIRRILTNGDFLPPGGLKLRLHIVGIVRRPLDLGERGGAGGVIVETPAFNAKYSKQIGSFNGYAMRIRTVTPADIPAVTKRAEQFFGRLPSFELQSLSVDNTGADGAIRVLANALFIFAAVAAVAGLAAIVIILNRELSGTRREQPTLLALGATRIERVAIAGARVGLIAGLGAALAGIGAILASPLFPFGVARRADPDPGLHADWLVLLFGVGAILVVVTTVGLLSGLRATRSVSADVVRRRPRLAARASELSATAGAPASMAAGIRMATEPGRGDRAVPVRSAFVGAAFAIAGLTAVFVFGASLERLATTPRRYGARFDFKIETNQDNACDTRDFGVAKLDGVASLDAICYANIQVGGRATFGWGSRPLRNSIGPEVIAGHAAATATEVALGAKTMRALRVRIGDTVDASSPVGHGVYRIVGQVVFPSLGDAQPLADGAWFTQDGLDTVIGPQTASSNANFTRVFLGRFAPGVNRRALVTRIEKLDFDPSGIPSQASAPQQPVEIHRLRQTGWFPIAIAALLAFLSLAAVGHALITGTRRRRRELALLKTLGFARRQVRFAISWQATFLSIASLIVGIPVGLLAGFAIWRAVANGLGVATDAVVPWLAFALIPLVILAMNAIAFFPARAAARMRPAVALRSE